MKKNIRNRWIDGSSFILMLALVSAVTLFLFNRQTHGNPSSYHSDMKAYILEMQGLDSGYSFPYPVFFKLAAGIHLIVAEPELSVAIATMLLNSLAILIFKWILNRIFIEKTEKLLADPWKWAAGVILSVLAISLFFVSMLFTPQGIYLPGIQFRYLGVFTPNPFHNATYMAARPFAILAFFSFAELLRRYENGCSGKFASGSRTFFGREKDEKIDIAEYLVFAGALLMTTLTKPSFTIVLVGAAGLIMLYRFCRNFSAKAAHAACKGNPGQNVISTIQLGLCFLPTFADLLYQYKGVFVADQGEEGGIGFGLGRVWNLYCGNLPLAICLACGFPLLVLILHYREIITNTLYRFSWQIYGMGFAMAYLLFEKGFREPDFNFAWGYEYGIFFCFTGALILLMEDTVRPGKTRKARILVILQWCAYLAHFLCGVRYFWIFLAGGNYY